MEEISQPTTQVPQDQSQDEQKFARMQEILDEEKAKADGEATEQRKRDLVDYVMSCYSTSKNWRQQSYESLWNRLNRNYMGIYDPDLAARKEPWQVKMFIPLTNQIVEVIKSSLFRLLFGDPNQDSVTPPPGADPTQSDLMNLLLNYYKRLSGLFQRANGILHQCMVYGTGIAKIYYDRRTRKVAQRIPRLSNPLLDFILRRPQQIEGLDTVVQDQMIFDGVCFDQVDLYDMFPEPSAEDFDEAHWFIQRGKLKFGDIVDAAQQGKMFPDAVADLYNVNENRLKEEDKQDRMSSYGEEVLNTAPTQKYQKEHQVLEYYGPLPAKWVFPDQTDLEDPEKLIAAHALVASGQTLLSVETNEDGKPPFVALRYIPIAGRFYGVGPAELVAPIQEEINEIRNLRVDNVNLIINRMFAVIESKLVSASDLVSRPGGFIRLKSVEDIKNALIPLEFPDVTRSAYQETFELEKQAQEVSGANKVTLGSGGSMARDVNQTLGGMQLVASMAGNRFAYIAMLMESQFSTEVTRKFYRNIYRYISPEVLMRILGPAAMMFQFPDPESLEREFDFAPSGIQTAEANGQKTQVLMSLQQSFAGNPLFNEAEALHRVLKLNKIENPESLIRMIPGVNAPLPPGAEQGGVNGNGNVGGGSGPNQEGGSPQGV